MFEFGLRAMNGFWGAIVGSLILCLVAAAPWNGGSDGVPVSTIGSADALVANASVASAPAPAITILPRLEVIRLIPPPTVSPIHDRDGVST